jgi:hypothetical protein
MNSAIAIPNRSFVDFRSSYVNNNDLPSVGRHRYGLQIDQRYQISPSWTQRWRGEWTSDPRYIQQFEGGYHSYQLPIILNEPSVTWQNDNHLLVNRISLHQDNLPREGAFTSKGTGLGPIDVLPHAIFSKLSTQLWGPLRSAADVEWLSLRRSYEGVDPVTDWIRSGDRATLKLNVSSPLVPGNFLMWDPMIDFRTDLYRFDGMTPDDSTAYRARVSMEQRLSTEFFRVYKSGVGELRALRHSVTPNVRWSYAPADWRSDHEFFTQNHTFGDVRGTLDSPRFDLFDPRPRNSKSDAVFTTADEESRLQEHNLLTLGIVTNIVARFGDETRRYERLIQLGVDQDYDLYSRLMGLMRFSALVSYGPFSSSFDWIYDKNHLKTSTKTVATYDNSNWKLRTSHRKSKSVNSLTAGISTEDFFGFSAAVSSTYDLRPELNKHRLVKQRFQLDYRSDSKCWFFSLDVDRFPDRDQLGHDTWNFNPKIGLLISDQGLDFAN